ncbi:glycosyltransferase family 4 protein [Shimia biformata]|uniref:glycosyltransferase family 4 protein n=1 Tax=Shimia biformata TaxID=1294299 RepID=UPI00194FE2DA|nr:glycosyltransferase family 4 protein [Shimia biformata]
MTQPKGKLAVVVKGWPRLSETFIAQELVALEARGHDLDIWSLRFPTDKKRHPLHDRLTAKVRYLPEYLYEEPRRVTKAMVRAMGRKGFWRALRIWAKDFARDRSTNRVRRFGQACVLAMELPPETSAFYAHFMHTPASVARYASIITGLPWAASAHAKDIWTSPEWEKREKLQESTHGATFLATCTGFGAEHLKGLADDPERVSLVYHGLDLARFPAPPEGRPPSTRFRMVSVGRLVEKKGFDRLIEALALLPTQLDWHWVHIGGGGDGALLKMQANRLGIDDWIEWRGACDQPEVIAAMREADLFVLPSRIAADGDRDGLPNVLMEAASQKLPILSTPVSAIPEFITSGKDGLLSDDDPKALAEAITLLANSPQMRAEMAEAAYQRLTRDFLMDPGIDALGKRLQEMVR